MDTIDTLARDNLITSLGLGIRAEFVPFSRSRNAEDKTPCLNWKVTLHGRAGDIWTGDYSAGVAHCPSYNVKVPSAWDRPDRMWKGEVTAFECEEGFKARGFTSWGRFSPDKTQPITPKLLDVISGLLLDGSALDYRSFEDWASEYGYDTDSRKAEAIYRACLDTGLKLRAALGDANLTALRNAFQDY